MAEVHSILHEVLELMEVVTEVLMQQVTQLLVLQTLEAVVEEQVIRL